MIGNALFFMLSSLGLLLSMRDHPREFVEWYGRRITRIYPSVWVTVILLTFPFGIHKGLIRSDNVLEEFGKFFFPPFWFLQALMIYYAIIFFIIRDFSPRRLLAVAVPVIALYAAYYVFMLDLGQWSIEGTPFRLIFYFLVALWGLNIGSKAEAVQFRGFSDVLFLGASVACVYGHKYLMQRGMFVNLQFMQHLASFPMLFYFVRVANSPLIRDGLMRRSISGPALTFLSAMTLEMFMVNNSLDPLGPMLGSFPINVIALLSLNTALALLIYFCAKRIRRSLESQQRVEVQVSRGFA